MNIKCLIVDDEPPALDELEYILSAAKDVDVIGTAASAGKAIDLIKSDEPDLVFLDIKMPGRDGFEVIKACATFPKTPFFVFATAYDEHAVEAFEASAVDYILKPFQDERVYESIQRVRQLMVTQHQGSLCGRLEKLMQRIQPVDPTITKISVERKGRILLLDPDAIVFCKAENKGVRVHTQTRAYELHGTTSLDDLESKLLNHGFFRSHRGYLVNLACVTEMVPWFNGKYLLTASDQSASEVPVSRRRVKSLKHRFGL